MSFQLSFLQKPGFLHAVVTGQNSAETVKKYLEEVLSECVTRGTSKVLIEERLEGPRLGLLDVFQIASDGGLQARGALETIAYVDVQMEGELMRFAGNVAASRGMEIGVFSTVEDAEEWLRGKEA